MSFVWKFVHVLRKVVEWCLNFAFVSPAPQSVYPQWITLSGFSSGGSFAQQFQISYSSLFSGIAVFSHSKL